MAVSPSTQAGPRGSATKAFLNSACGNADKARDALVAAGVETEEAQADALPRHLEQAVAGGAIRILVAGRDRPIASAAGLLAGQRTAPAFLPGGSLHPSRRAHGTP